jgi:hypothetical protein
MKELFIFLAVIYTGDINPAPNVKDYIDPDKILMIKVKDLTKEQCEKMAHEYDVAGGYGFAECLPQKVKK